MIHLHSLNHFLLKVNVATTKYCNPIRLIHTTKSTPITSQHFYQYCHRHRFLSSSSTTNKTIQIPIHEARDTTAQALRKIGWDDESATLQAEIMTSAELCGNNQGLVKMYQPQLMAPSPGASKPTLERDLLSSVVVNGNQSPGMVVAAMAADLAVEKVTSSSDAPVISIVTTYNTSTSSGQLGYYVQRMAEKGIIGIAFANSPEFVAPSAGAKPVFGTNPLAVGIPRPKTVGNTTTNSPFVFDMATSAIALFGVLTSKAQGTPLPNNVAYDRDGNWTTDASKVLDDGGSIATFGGHKGAGLSLCVELLAGALSGAAVLGQVDSKRLAKNWGHAFIAIRPSGLLDDYETRVESVIQTVKASGPNVRIPGENSASIAREREKEGYLPIPEKIWESIVKTSKQGL